MLKTNLKRVIRGGVMNFWRNAFVSLSSITVMVIALSVFSSIVFMGAILNFTLEEIRDKVDINVYFNLDAEEFDILNLKSSLESLPEVESVIYVSKEEALENFRERHRNEPLILQTLEELGDNPLEAILNIKAYEPGQYAGITEFLEVRSNILSADGSVIVDRVNYHQNKIAIDSLTKIIESSKRLGFIFTLILVFISVLITFNTIRLAIYISREEISVMKLVGASNSYIKSPFVVTGILYGISAAIITQVLFYPITFWLGSETERFFEGLNVYDYYISNFFQIFILLLISGIFIGALSSFLAIKKYLKV